MKVAIILGTRPEIIKMLSVIRECERKKIDYSIIHTGQHYSYDLDAVFFDELEIPRPGYNLCVGSDVSGKQISSIVSGVEKILLKEKPDVVLVEGDTNSVLGGALAASKQKIKLGHIEAGLRSYDRSMPEELNRIIVDHISDYLFTPTRNAKDILIKEEIPKNKIHVTGNTIVDAVYQNAVIAKEKSQILEKLNLQKNKYFLATFHRQENVDRKTKIKGILGGLGLVAKKFNTGIICPMHPRTRKRIKEFNLEIPEGINVIEPVGYFDFLLLEKNARFILSDSGGIQEEACILGVPCVTLRENTERPETLDIKSNILAGTKKEDILSSAEKMLTRKTNWKNPFGDGKAAKKIINVLEESI